MEDLIKRINELARLSKERELTAEEKEEQQKLRKEYVKLFREGFKQQLLSVKVIDQDNNDITPTKLKNEKNRLKGH